MAKIRQKLQSRSGASLLLAMVFLLLCVFVGGSVLAAATANAGRVAHLKQEQQTYLSQRSAMQLMAQMLKGTEENQLQLTIKDVTVDGDRTVTFTIHNDAAEVAEKSVLQKLLYEFAVYQYAVTKGVSKADMAFVNFRFTGDTNGVYTYSGFAEHMDTVDIAADFPVNGGTDDGMLQATYSISDNHDLQITFTDGEPAYMNLTMNAYSSTGHTITITVDGVTTTTTTTIIRWDDPVISKGGA